MRLKCQREKCILVPPVWKLELSTKFRQSFHNFLEVPYSGLSPWWVYIKLGYLIFTTKPPFGDWLWEQVPCALVDYQVWKALSTSKVKALVCAKSHENLLTALLAVPVPGCKSDDDSAVYLMTMSPLDFVSTISITPINIIIIISINFIT